MLFSPLWQKWPLIHGQKAPNLLIKCLDRRTGELATQAMPRLRWWPLCPAAPGQPGKEGVISTVTVAQFKHTPSTPRLSPCSLKWAARSVDSIVAVRGGRLHQGIYNNGSGRVNSIEPQCAPSCCQAKCEVCAMHNFYLFRSLHVAESVHSLLCGAHCAWSVSVAKIFTSSDNLCNLCRICAAHTWRQRPAIPTRYSARGGAMSMSGSVGRGLAYWGIQRTVAQLEDKQIALMQRRRSSC